jgi:hypothetical protein
VDGVNKRSSTLKPFKLLDGQKALPSFSAKKTGISLPKDSAPFHKEYILAFLYRCGSEQAHMSRRQDGR